MSTNENVCVELPGRRRFHPYLQRPLPESNGGDVLKRMPVSEVCKEFDLQNISIKYTEEDFKNLTNFSLFHSKFRPIFQEMNPKAPMSELKLLFNLKWKEFCAISQLKALKEPEEVSVQTEDIDKDHENDGSLMSRKRKGSRQSATKAKKRMKMAIGFFENEDDDYLGVHQEYCEVCQKVGDVIPCSTCSRAYHLACLDPKQKEVPEDKWSCPHCLSDNATGKVNAKETRKKKVKQPVVCKVCKEGGNALCRCDTCEFCFHTYCVVPPLTSKPEGSWTCLRCQCKEIPYKVQKILTWRWKDAKAFADLAPLCIQAKRAPLRRREFFVKLEGRSYWDCRWLDVNFMEVYCMPLLRSYIRKNNMEEPPKLEDLLVNEEQNIGADNQDDLDESSTESIKWTPKRITGLDSNGLHEKYYQYGVRPDWLVPHRVINHCTVNEVLQYLVKWRELPYDMATWEEESRNIPGLKCAIDEYHDLKYACGYESKKRKSGEEEEEQRQCRYRPPLQIPTTSLSKKLEVQPEYVAGNNGMVLHPYQMDGLNWLRYSWANQTNTVLADEMGLGKTIQTIVFLYSLYKEGHCRGPFLVVVPLSTIINWEREFETWAPGFYVVTYGGSQSCRRQIQNHDFSFEQADVHSRSKISRRKANTVKFHVLLTSYEMVSKVGDDYSLLGSIDWAVLVVDEAHRLKNNQSKLFILLNNYSIQYKLLLTGTPLQNNLEEMFNLFNFLCPESFKSLPEFQNEFATINEEEKIKKLHNMLGPHMLRRLKCDVLKDMPSKSEFIIRVELSPMQKQYYRYVLTKNYKALNSKSGGHQMSLLNIVMDLRKCCNHPYLFQKAQEEALYNPDGTYDLAELTKNAGKLVLLSKMLRLLKKQGHRVLIFSQMTKLLDILEHFLVGENYRYERIDGTITGTSRQEAIDRFNAPNAEQFVFLLSTKAGGLGINLATADTVIIYDSDWNPQNDIQAFARAHRIGQTNKVMIYRFVTRNSVEEKIVQLAKKKMMLTHLVVRSAPGGTPGKTGFSKQELENILKFGTEELFKDDGDGEEIHYDEKAVEDLLDRSKEGVEQKESSANEYLSSFKVATYSTKEGIVEGEVESKFIKQETENPDPVYWENLLSRHCDQVQETVDDSLGKGKRVRRQVNYTVVIQDRDGDLHGNGANNQSDYAAKSERGGKRKIPENQQSDPGALQPRPPKLAKVNGSFEVLGFNAQQRKAFLKAVMRYGMPLEEAMSTQWLMRDLKGISEQHFRSYASLFMRHLLESGNESDATFSDGVPRENICRQDVLTRMGILALIRKKVAEFETFNGYYSMPELVKEIVAGTEPKQKISAENQVVSTEKKTIGEIKLELKGEEEKQGWEEQKGLEASLPMESTLSIDTLPVVSTEKNTEEASEQKTKPVEETLPCSREAIAVNKEKATTGFTFNITDYGFTELQTLWLNEEKVSATKGIREVWNHRHDYWLLAGVAAHGYNRWKDIQNDKRFSIINEPFKLNEGKIDREIKNKFLVKRFKLLEKALVVEDQIRRASQLPVIQEAGNDAITITARFPEIEYFAEYNQ
ncbi:hypothetical protein QYM36_011889, partial [Artemia franciscana]